MPEKKKRSIYKTSQLQFHYLKKSGFYNEIGKSFLRLSLIVIVIFALLYFVGTKFLDIDEIFNYLVHSVPKHYVFVLFYITESFFNPIPTDLFIIWSEELSKPWLNLTLLSLLSYIAGINSYFFGYYIRKIPRINRWFSKKFTKQIRNSKKWGGWVIAAAAMTPFPFSLTVVSIGLLNYPFKQFLIWSLLRIPRFFLYAFILYKTVNIEI